MDQLPLHPAIVHIPVGVALVLPLVAIGLTWALWTGRCPRGAFAVVAGLLAVAFAGGLAAVQTGEQDEERVEQVVPERYIEAHEEAGEAFVWGAGIATGLGITVLFLPAAVSRWAAVAATAASIIVAGLAFNVGRAGGKLVYQHGAASVHVPASAKSAPPDGSDGAERRREGEEHETEEE